MMTPVSKWWKFSQSGPGPAQADVSAYFWWLGIDVTPYFLLWGSVVSAYFTLLELM